MLKLKCIDWGPGVSFTTVNVGYGETNGRALVPSLGVVDPP
jgi:hypothetical protein